MTTTNKTCPFCGGQAIHYVTDGDKHFIGCDVCGAESEDADSAEEAWSIWNTRRVEPDSAAAELARLKEMSKNLVLADDGHIYLKAPDGSLEISSESDAACRAIAREVIRGRDAAASNAERPNEPPSIFAPLEAMAVAIHRVDLTQGGPGLHRGHAHVALLEEDIQQRMVTVREYARAALLALAEFPDLDRAIIEVAEFGNEASAVCVEQHFRGMCRALAGEITK